MSHSQRAIQIGILVLFMGFILVFSGMLFSTGGSNGEFGGVLLIGPIPIVFGSSPEITSTMLWAGVVIALVYLFTKRVS
ncbi:TIGR00304 family membrane protein [Methanolobus halotolerans]|uniref:TIGR00304 family protein n=1 Tax=Methanolobus halotolerans TaxID=2052935 RepID=A0A4E0QBT5_9EURY|nr:DUF131 domain-containing protein [Methanolobus halotolerans]TGC10644.1 hypothetical protein CUN85_03915 [Methanolobus halotolerans]